jgi:hypothetical protein
MTGPMAPAARPPQTPQLPPQRLARARLRLVRLHLLSRRIPAAIVALAACAIGLRIALHWHWDTYGALQLPLIFETGCAAVITLVTASPLGEPERVTGQRLPLLRLGATLALTALAFGALAAVTAGTHLAGGNAEVLRNLAGITGIGLLCAAALGGALAWAGPLAYMVAGAYGLYADWHGPPLTTPWLWPARPAHDAGAALCAGLVWAAGVAVITARGARDPAGE